MWRGTPYPPRRGGSEQGDPLMPPAFVAAQARLESDKLMAYLDDVYIVSQEPDHVGNGYAVVQHELFHLAKIQVNRGKTKVWNRAGVRPQVCDVLEQLERESDCRARVWRGSGGYKCLAHLWVTQRISKSNWRSLQPNISNSWTRPRPSQICSVLGDCCCIAGLLVRTIS